MKVFKFLPYKHQSKVGSTNQFYKSNFIRIALV
jgi:hypothetical protein